MNNNEKELQALNNVVDNLELTGYKVVQNKMGKIDTFCFRDPEGMYLTGWWDYAKINHYIMGYGKAFNKYKPH